MNTGLLNHNKTTKQQEKALAIDSGVDRCASALRKVEKSLKTLPTQTIFLDCRGVCHFFSFYSQDQATSGAQST